MTPHAFHLVWTVTVAEQPADVTLDGSWQVTDPVSIVHNRMGAVGVLYGRLRERLESALANTSTAQIEIMAVEAAVRAAMPREMVFPEGLRATELVVRLSRRRSELTGADLMLHVLADDVDREVGQADVAELWRRDLELAQSSMRALVDNDPSTGEERDSLISAALARYAELTTALGELIPPTRERDTDETGSP